MAKNTEKKNVVKKRVTKKKATNARSLKKPAPKKTAEKKKKKATVKASKTVNNQIVLNAILSINDAKKMYDEFAKAIDAGEEIVIDASSVEMIDTAMMQLILAFVSKAQLSGIAMKWLKPSNELVNRCELLGLRNAMGLGEVTG